MDGEPVQSMVYRDHFPIVLPCCALRNEAIPATANCIRLPSTLYWPAEIYQYCVYAKDSNAVSMVMISSQNRVVSNLRLGLGAT